MSSVKLLYAMYPGESVPTAIPTISATEKAVIKQLNGIKRFSHYPKEAIPHQRVAQHVLNLKRRTKAVANLLYEPHLVQQMLSVHDSGEIGLKHDLPSWEKQPKHDTKESVIAELVLSKADPSGLLHFYYERFRVAEEIYQGKLPEKLVNAYSKGMFTLVALQAVLLDRIDGNLFFYYHCTNWFRNGGDNQTGFDKAFEYTSQHFANGIDLLKHFEIRAHLRDVIRLLLMRQKTAIQNMTSGVEMPQKFYQEFGKVTKTLQGAGIF